MDKEVFVAHYQNTDVEAENIYKAQSIARDCLEYMTGFLKPGMNRKTVHEECARYMNEKGSEGWWIHNDPALILFGELSTYSAHEDPSPLFAGKKIGENDLITIDVAPMIGNGWGDMARSFVMEKGKIISWELSENEEIRAGMELEMRLHRLFIDSIRPGMTFSALHRLIDDQVKEAGYRNCDYHGNYGHTIENDQKDRVTIAEGVDVDIIGYDKPITFEPHICRIGGTLGIKHENMYAYINGKMEDIL